ncbi:Multidrug resistance protein YkkC [Oceanobacillus oncorhynchi]|uniref:Multidrug resistance protein YkkC n=1 Tax=Oceanobacillus oncorhynchi TaxID=545501 RepID=A0A0A1MRW9_9BACI|nr:Multidrug resistance protein YkkC [Oceanobacillus oncorhynchi]
MYSCLSGLFLIRFLEIIKVEVFAVNRNWMKVFVAAFLEIFWVIGLTHAYDFWTWTGTVICIIVSNYLMITAAQVLPAGTVYAIFVGLGTAGTVIAGFLFFGEAFKWEKVILIATLLAGVMGLKLVTPDKAEKGAES